MDLTIVAGGRGGRCRDGSEAGDDVGVALEFNVEWVIVSANVAAPSYEDAIWSRDGDQANGCSPT